MQNKLTVLSLFDGISCGQVALERADIPLEKYYASEIDPTAIRITQKNYPDTIQLGDATKVQYNQKTGILSSMNGIFQTGKINLLIGGSPCTDLSSIGYAKGMVSGSVEIKSLNQYLQLKEKGASFTGQSYLFWEYVRLLHEIKPDYFLLENVVMAKKWQTIINEAFGIDPIKINSSLVSAQNRPRLYWTNIPNVHEPEDMKISIDDILTDNAPTEDVSHCKTVKKGMDKLQMKYGYIPSKFNAYNGSEIKTKACALSRGSMVTSSCATLIFVPVKNDVHTIKNGILDKTYNTKLPDGKYNIRKLSITEMERLQTLPDDYTKVTGIGSQKRSAAIGNGWTVDVIAHIFASVKKFIDKT